MSRSLQSIKTVAHRCRPIIAFGRLRTARTTAQISSAAIESAEGAAAAAARDGGGPPLAPPAQHRRSRPTQGQLAERCLMQGPPTIDIGANLVDRSFDKDRPAVLDRAARAGVAACVVTGTCVQSSGAAAELCASGLGDRYNLFFTAGVHCHNAKGCDDSTLGALRQLAAHERCVAIGECGLDFNRNFSPPDVQERWFAAQVQLAEELQLPLFLHCRDAGPRFAEILREHRRSVPGVVHCFTGSRAELEEFLSLGLHIGITGWVADDRPERGGAELAALLPLIPDDRLLIETDCPYLTPRSIGKARPQRNEPALLPHVLAAVAAARGQSPRVVAELTTRNAAALFRLPGLELPGLGSKGCPPVLHT